MTWITVIISVLFVVSAFILNCWIIYVYSAPVFQEIQRRIVVWFKSLGKREGTDDEEHW